MWHGERLCPCILGAYPTAKVGWIDATKGNVVVENYLFSNVIYMSTVSQSTEGHITWHIPNGELHLEFPNLLLYTYIGTHSLKLRCLHASLSSPGTEAKQTARRARTYPSPIRPGLRSPRTKHREDLGLAASRKAKASNPFDRQYDHNNKQALCKASQAQPAYQNSTTRYVFSRNPNTTTPRPIPAIPTPRTRGEEGEGPLNGPGRTKSTQRPRSHNPLAALPSARPRG
ncbi:hypothetical protein F5X98DRAFT_131627 [Xylaria grammica]|nr:hypothetical protein F5X98DRAFT_131627 [Xylaria grammica]